MTYLRRRFRPSPINGLMAVSHSSAASCACTSSGSARSPLMRTTSDLRAALPKRVMSRSTRPGNSSSNSAIVTAARTLSIVGAGNPTGGAGMRVFPGVSSPRGIVTCRKRALQCLSTQIGCEILQFEYMVNAQSYHGVDLSMPSTIATATLEHYVRAARMARTPQSFTPMGSAHEPSRDHRDSHCWGAMRLGDLVERKSPQATSPGAVAVSGAFR